MKPVIGMDADTGEQLVMDAHGNGVDDDFPVLDEMLRRCGLIALPMPGVYAHSATLKPRRMNGCGILGASCAPTVSDGSLLNAGTVLMATFAEGSSIISPEYVTGPTYQNLVIDRSVPCTSGYGLDMNVSNDYANLFNLWSQHHVIGYNLATTGYSRAEYCRAEANSNNGMNVAGQWQLDRCFSTGNGGCGFAATNSIPAGNSLGQWKGLSTWNNKSHGIGFFGAVFDIRLSDSFFGGDGGFEVYVLQNGNNHNQFTNIEIESGGVDFGWYFGPGTGSNTLVNCSTLGGGKKHGIMTLAPKLSLIGGAITDEPGYGVLIGAATSKVSMAGVVLSRNGWDVGAIIGGARLAMCGCLCDGDGPKIDTATINPVSSYGHV